MTTNLVAWGQYPPPPPPLPSPLSSSAPAPVRQHSHSTTPSKRPTVPKRDPTTQLSTIFPDGHSPKVPWPNSPRRSMECGQLPPSPEPSQIALLTTSSTVLPSADQSVPPVSDIIRRFDQAKLHTDGISRTSPPIQNCRFPSPPLGFCSDNSTHEPSFQKNMASREPDYPNRSSYASQFIPSPPIPSSHMPSRACLSSGSPPLRSPTSPSSQMMSEWNFSQFNEVVGKLVPCSPPPPSHPSSVLISANSLETNHHHRQVTLHSMQLDPSTLNTLLEYNITDPYQIPDFQPITHGQAVWKQHKLERKNREAAVAYAANLRKWDKVPTWKRELIEKRQMTKPLTPTTPHRDQHHEQQQPDVHSLISAELTAKLKRRLEIVNAVSESSPSS